MSEETLVARVTEQRGTIIKVPTQRPAGVQTPAAQSTQTPQAVSVPSVVQNGQERK